MRIALLDSWLRSPAEGSGTAAAISGLEQGLGDEGHEVVALRPRRGLAGVGGRSLFNLSLRMGRRLRDVDPHLVVGFDLDGFLLPPRDRRPWPLVVQLKGVASDEARFEHGPSRVKLSLLGRLEGRNARRGDLVIAPSAYSARTAEDLYGLAPGTVQVVPEGIDLGAWANAAPPGPETREPDTILTVGRQYPRKNTRALLDALPAVASRVPGVRLRVVGGGPELPRLRRQVRKLGLEERVHFQGPMNSGERIREEYLSATCFCLPSLQEGFGIVLLEAMAAGLPVVACRSAAIPEVVLHEDSALLVEPGESRALSDALVRVLQDPALRRRFGEAGRRRVQRFALPRVTRRFLEVVSHLLPASNLPGPRRTSPDDRPGSDAHPAPPA